MASQPARSSLPHGIRLPWLAFPAVALVVVAFWAVWMESRKTEADGAIGRRATELAAGVEDRAQQYATMLRGAAEYAALAKSLSRVAWERYAASLDLQRGMPEVTAFGYIDIESGKFVADRLRPSVRVWHEVWTGQDSRPTMNTPGRGTDAPWWEVAELSPGSDGPRTIVLPGKEVAMIAPVRHADDSHFAPASSPATTRRLKESDGWVYVILRLDAMLARAVPPGEALPLLDLTEISGVTPRRLYSSMPADNEALGVDLLTSTRPVSVGDQKWALKVSVPSSMTRHGGLPAGLGVLALALCAALAATGWLVAATGSKRRAFELARDLTLELQGRTQELQVITDNSPLGIFRWSADLNGVWLNSRCEQLIGLREKEVLAQGWEATAIPAERDRLRTQWNSALWQGAELDIEYQCRHPGGKELWLRVRSAPVKLAGGVVGVVGTVEDITAAKAASLQLSKSRAFLEAVVDSIPAAVFVKDARHRFVLSNEFGSRLLGLSRESIKGLSDADLHDADRTRFYWDQDDHVLETGESLANEEEFASADGVRRWVMKTKHRVVAGDGERFVVAAIFDMTAQRQAQTEAQRAREFLDQLLDTLPNPIFVKNQRREWVLVNRAFCEYAGRTREQLIGQTDPIHDGRTSRRALEDDSVLVSGRTIVSEDCEVEDTGSLRWVIKSKSRIQLPDGSFGVAGALTDITLQKTAETRVNEARQFLTKVLDSIPLPLFVKDTEHRFRLVNRAFCEIVAAGARPEDVIGRNDEDLFGVEWARYVYRQDDVAFASEEPVISEERAGTVSGHDMYVLKSKRAIRLDDGTVLLVGISTDISAARKAQSDAEEARHFLKAVLNAIPEPVFVKDRAHQFIITNLAFRNLVAPEQPESYFLGKTDEQVMPVETARIAFEQDDQAFAAVRPLRFEQRWTGNDGVPRFMVKTKAKVLVGDKAFIVGVNTDITQARRAAEEAERARQFLNSVIDAMPQDVYVKDDAGRWLIVNQAMCETFQVPRERLVGFTAADLLPPEKARVIEAQDREVLAGDGPRVYESKALPEGRAHQWLLMTKSPVRLADGSRYLVGVNTDVTALREALLEVERARQFFDLTINAMQQGLMVKDREGRFVTANKAWCALAGVSLEQIQGRTVWDIYPEAEARVLQAQDDAAYASGEPVVFEQPASSVSRRQGWILKTKSVLRLQDGAMFLVSGTVDITKIKRTEQALLESQSRLRVLNAVAGAMARGGGLEDILDAAVAAIASGYPQWRVCYAEVSDDRYLNVTHSRAPAGMSNLLGMQYDTDSLSLLRAAMLSGSVFTSEDIYLDPRCEQLHDLVSSGQARAIMYMPLLVDESWKGLLAISLPVAHTWADHETQMLGETAEYLRIAMRQASAEAERSAATEALRRREARTRQVHAVSQGITTNMPLETTIGIALQGLREALHGMSICFASVGDGDVAQVTQRLLADGTEGAVGDHIDFESPLTSSEVIRSERPLAMARTESAFAQVPLYDQGRVVALLRADAHDSRAWSEHECGTLREVGDVLQIAVSSARINRERERAQAELRRHRDNLQQLVDERTLEAVRAKDAAERANLAKSEFLANMSHELRTPMHAILSFAQLGVDRAARGTEALPKLRQYLERIRDSGQRLLNLLNDLLDLSKLEAGRMNYEFGRHDIRNVVEEVLGELAPLARQREVVVRCSYESDALSAWCDAGRIGQVVRNLLSNALKFTPGGKSVNVKVMGTLLPEGRRSGDATVVPAIEISVADEGLGIPEGELELIFDKFVQSSKTKSGAGGTGLGLAICREIVTQHGGYIEAAHNRGGGALFTFAIRQEAPVDHPLQRDEDRAPAGQEP